MTSYDFRIFGEWLAGNELANKPISQYSRAEINKMVDFIIGVFGDKPKPCQVLIDSADRLVVPANADESQMKMAIRLIEKMMENQVEIEKTIEVPA